MSALSFIRHQISDNLVNHFFLTATSDIEVQLIVRVEDRLTDALGFTIGRVLGPD